MPPRHEAPSPEDVERCLRTLEALSALEPSALRQVPQAGRVLAAGYSLARRAGRSLRDPTWQRPTATVTHPPSPPPAAPPEPTSRRRCYVCRAAFRTSSPTARLCPDCDAAQTLRRARSADLHGRVALVTGARIRIGYAVSLRLLRAGATVHATTRFAHDALARYSAEADFDAWSARLHLHALDLCDLRAVLAWIETLTASLPRLDILINNAARTIDHPAAWIDAMRAQDARAAAALPPGPLGSLGGFTSAHAPDTTPDTASALATFTPALDAVGQPLDVRPHNAWRSPLGAVAPPELLAVHAVNALAPFLLVNGLRGRMARDNPDARFVVNVSATEGQFERVYKSSFHPHTNMAKAALNMLTRTSADDLARERIYMVSVDPGWVANQNPQPLAERQEARGYSAPLGMDDAAARVLDPVVSWLHGEPPRWGVLLKDFVVAPW